MLPKIAGLATTLLVLSGCGLKTPTEPDTLVDGVGIAGYELRAEGTDVIHVTTFFPVPLEGKHPAIVFIPGGFVASDRYAWQAQAWAKAGFIVAVPDQLFELGFFSVDYGEQARKLLVAPPAGSVLADHVQAVIGIGGHSLGGVVAAKLASRGQFPALLLEASYPDTADQQALQAVHPLTLSIGGTLDCSAPQDKVRAGFDTLAAPAALAMVEGMTHYQFTDSQKEDESRQCTPGISLDEAHQRVTLLTTRFFQRLDLLGPWNDVAGTTVEVK